MPPHWLLLLLLFWAPLLRVARPLWRALGGAGSALNGAIGGCERRLSGLRELLVGGAALWSLARADGPLDPALDEPAYLGALVALLALARAQRKASELVAISWLSAAAELCPEDFRAFCDQLSGPAGGPEEGPRTRPRPREAYDMRAGLTAPKASLLAWPRAVLGSIWITRLLLLSASRLHPQSFVERFYPTARLWSMTLLEASRSRLERAGLERLEALPPGPRILMFNHVSQTDWGLGFAALDPLTFGPARLRMKYIVARDHFIDNPLVYHSGLGRCIERSGMIAVRRGSGHRDAAVKAMEDAAEAVSEQLVDVAIYPQGTRARAHFASDGRRLGAGFYSSAKRKRAREPLAHMRRGSAYLALDVARLLSARGMPIHLACIGIRGAGSQLPKGSLSMELGHTVRFTVEEVWSIGPEAVAGLEKYDDQGALTAPCRARADALTRRIERGLAAACDIDARLAAIWRAEFSREMPDSAALRRLFDHALSIPPKRRGPLFEALSTLPAELDDERLTPLFDQLESLA